MAQKTIHLETDYLIIGGGAMCMAFVDEMLIGSRNFGKGSSINDVIPIFQFLDPPPSPCHPSYALKITPNCHFLYPPPSPFGVTPFMDGPLHYYSR